ncbi:MAG: SDR family oxidoreductase [Candidatus Neomarinimicrobiota bacterium]
MSLTLKNKHAIVCGSTDGIGKATAILFALQGCEVSIIARNQNKLDDTLSLLNTDLGQLHQSICVDFDEPEVLKRKVDNHIRSLGKTVDILVNNSGGPKGGPLIEAEESEFRLAFERLLICNHIMARAVFPGMKIQGSGRIINIISTSVNQVIPGLGVSNSIRGSVAQWGKTLALELGEHGICVNNILPGYTATNRLKDLADNKASSLGVSREDVYSKWMDNISLRRLANPKEIANTIIFLASDESSYVTGHNLSVDGGRFGV